MRAHRQRLEDVLPGAHAAIEQDLNAVARDIGNARQRRDGAGGAVKLTAAMIGNDDGVGAHVGGALGVFGIENAFDDQLAGP